MSNNNHVPENELPEIDTDVSARDRVDELTDSVRQQAVEIADDIRKSAPIVAAAAREEIDELAHQVKKQAEHVSKQAHHVYEDATSTPAKRRQMKYWTSVGLALVVGIVMGFVLDGGNNATHNEPMPEMSMQQMMQQMSSSMDGLTGEQLEQQFIADMIVHHQGAIDMAMKLVGGAGVTNDALRAMAADIIRTQSAEIEQMKAWVK